MVVVFVRTTAHPYCKARLLRGRPTVRYRIASRYFRIPLPNHRLTMLTCTPCKRHLRAYTDRITIWLPSEIVTRLTSQLKIKPRITGAGSGNYGVRTWVCQPHTLWGQFDVPTKSTITVTVDPMQMLRAPVVTRHHGPIARIVRVIRAIP